MKKYRADIILWGTVVALLFCSYQLREIVLPFYIALVLAYIFNPFVLKIGKVIKNRILAVITTLLIALIFFFGLSFVFANEIARDVNRLGSTFAHFKEVNSEKIDESANWVKQHFSEYVEPVLKKGEGKIDSLANEDIGALIQNDSLVSQINFEELEGVYNSIFSSDSEEGAIQEESGANWIVIILSSIGYFIYVIFTWEYFESRLKRISNRGEGSRLTLLLKEAKSVFKSFFLQRGLIVLIYIVFFIVSFYLLGLPGALILGLISGLLCFVPYLQYIMLFPIAICCIILNMEGEFSYIFYLSIAIGVFVIGTLLEELVLYPKIMKQSNSINPAILMVSIAVFGEVMGLFGVLLAVPMTILLKSYFKRILFPREA